MTLIIDESNVIANTPEIAPKPAWKAPIGSWKCVSCANINYPTRSVCNRCQLARTPDLLTATPGTPLAWMPIPGQMPRLDTTFRPPVGSWRCPRDDCKNINFPQRTHCNRCQTPQPSDGQGVKTPPASKMKPGCWVCPKSGCNNVNFPFRDVCHRCNTLKPFAADIAPLGLAGYAGLQASPALLAMQAAMLGLAPLGFVPPNIAVAKKWTPPPGSWRCPNATCNNVNFASRKTCNRCQQARE